MLPCRDSLIPLSLSLSIALVGCGSSSGGAGDAGGDTGGKGARDGGVALVPFTDWPASSHLPESCDGDIYVTIEVDECGCGTNRSYAICDSGSFSECACSIPPGYASYQ
jgi:hypothetical protein